MQVVGHRGAAGHAPENSLTSMRKALELGVDWIECDVWRLRSGEVVVIHDATWFRTTTGQGSVKETNLATMRQFRLKQIEETVPLLTDVMQVVLPKAKLNIEIKDPDALEGTIAAVREQVRQHQLPWEHIRISAFDHRVLERARSVEPNLPRVVLLDLPLTSHEIHVIAREYAPVAIYPGWGIVSEEMVKAIHQVGCECFVWTVNDPEMIAIGHQLRLDGIISDFPNRVRK